MTVIDKNHVMDKNHQMKTNTRFLKSVELSEFLIFSKHPFRGFLIKRCSENMQQIYRRTPMSKCGFNEVAKQLY